MKLLIVTATQAEVQPLIESGGPGIRMADGFFSLKQGQFTTDVLIAGIGMVATAYALTKCLLENNYDAVINAGICGSFTQELQIGEVVNITSDFFPEMGAESEEGFLPAPDAGLLNPERFPFMNGRLKPDSGILAGLFSQLKKVSGATVNTVHGREETIREFRNRFQADTESMEGAAFFYCCMMQKTPCIQLRSVSNYVTSRNTSQWNSPLAVAELNKVLLKVLKEISGS